MTDSLKILKMMSMSQNDIDYWIAHNLANYQSKNHRKVASDSVKLIISWLRSPASKKARRQIKKLSVSTASHLSQQWAKKLDKKASSVENFAAINTVYLFKDNHSIVQLIGRSAFQREGKLMQHCVAYYNQDDQVVYSLRDEKNQPHCTIEVLSGKIVQVKGIKNGIIAKEKRTYVKEFIFNYLKNTPFTSDYRNLALIQKKDKTFYDLDSDTYALVVEEDLDLSECGLTRIPSIMCFGKLNLRNNKITEIPSNFIQTGPLILEKNLITHIPLEFKQTHFLDLSSNQIQYLPRDFKQGAILDLSNNAIRALPENFEQTSDLILSNNKIRYLPENFKQTHTLDLSYNQLQALPKNFKHTSDLHLTRNEIKSLPSNFEQALNKALVLAHNQIKSLPKNFKQRGRLVLSYNKISKLPVNFIQTDILFIAGNQLEFLPKTFKQTSYSLNLSDNKLLKLPDGFVLNSDLNVSNNCLNLLAPIKGYFIFQKFNQRKTSLAYRLWAHCKNLV